jgi:peroxiredoxin
MPVFPIPPSLFMAFALWLFGLHPTTEKAQLSQQRDNLAKLAPDFALPDLEGRIVRLKDMKGSIVIIHIAATWCPFCNAEAPNLEKLAQDYKDKKVNVLIIDVKEPKELVTAKLQDRFKFTFPVLLDADGTVAASFAPPDAQPDLARDEVMIASNLLIDPEGNIKFISLLDSKNFDAKLTDLKATLDELLASP